MTSPPITEHDVQVVEPATGVPVRGEKKFGWLDVRLQISD